MKIRKKCFKCRLLNILPRVLSINMYSMIFVCLPGACLPSEFRCPRTRRCISQSDTCNKHNPCGDFTDCTKKKSQKSTQDGLDVPTIIGVIISVGFLLILLILVIAVIKRRSLRPTERVSTLILSFEYFDLAVVCVTRIWHITRMLKENICNTRNPHFGNETMVIFSFFFFLGVLKIITCWIRHWSQTTIL